MTVTETVRPTDNFALVSFVIKKIKENNLLAEFAYVLR